MRHSQSMLVFGMVLIGWSILFLSLPFFLLLTAVTELISIVRTEISIAPNVELIGKTETDFIDHNESKSNKVLYRSHFPGTGLLQPL